MRSETLRTNLRRLLSALAFALFVVYAIASHFFPDSPLYATLPLAVSCAIALVLSVGGPWRAPAVVAAAAAIWAVWHYDPAWLVYAPPVLLQALVGLVFFSTLRDPERNLIARIVALVHGGVVPSEVRMYTRQLTFAWGVFMMTMAGIALVLALFAPHAWWSMFANVLSYFIFGAFFACEYLYRRWRFPHAPHASPLEVAAALRRHGFFRVMQKGD